MAKYKSCTLDELEWPSLEARRGWSFLLLFHKIHNGAMSVETDKYLTPARSSKVTGVSSHSAQSCRYQTYEPWHVISNNVVF